MIYLDSSAVVKLVKPEEHSTELRDHLASTETQSISSELAKVEVCRTLLRNGRQEQNWAHAERLLDQIAQLPMSGVLRTAREIPPPSLRSLDALHLATALSLGPVLTQFITYDRQLGRAAAEIGLPVRAPGLVATG